MHESGSARYADGWTVHLLFGYVKATAITTLILIACCSACAEGTISNGPSLTLDSEPETKQTPVVVGSRIATNRVVATHQQIPIVRAAMRAMETGKFLMASGPEVRGWLMTNENRQVFQRSFLQAQGQTIIPIGAEAVPELIQWLAHTNMHIRYIAYYCLEQITGEKPFFPHFATLGELRAKGWLTAAEKSWSQWYSKKKEPDQPHAANSVQVQPGTKRSKPQGQPVPLDSVRISGQVLRPGDYPHTGGMRVEDLVNSAGGLGVFASGIRVVRSKTNLVEEYYGTTRRTTESKYMGITLEPGDQVWISGRQ